MALGTLFCSGSHKVIDLAQKDCIIISNIGSAPITLEHKPKSVHFSKKAGF
jgi:hypothetical protein